MRSSAVVLAVLFAGGCHPLACWLPADLPKDQPLVLVSKDGAWPKADVEVDVDDLGIPHIYGDSEPDLAYALGVMHARDRLFQIFLYVHAGEGRLTELLGKDLLEVDRQNRIITHRVDEQLANLGRRDRDIIDAYCAGVNEGAAMVGKSAEMSILGVEWQTLRPIDVLAIVRLQQWDQSVGFNEEMARYRLVKQLGKDSPVAQALLIDAPSFGVPIVTAEEHDGAAYTPVTSGTSLHTPPPDAAVATDRVADSNGAWLRALKDDIAERFSRGGSGASNSWSVDGAHTASGKAIVANDPHLGHAAPGVFYLADMHGPDFVAAGGTFPGIPAVLIGHGQHVAWGITNAFADTQDVVVVHSEPGQSGSYVVDGEAHAFGLVKQTFKLGKEKNAPVHEETWKTTIFGPLLPPGYGSYGGAVPLVAEGEQLALLWTAAQFPEDNGRFLSFWDLAKATTAAEATIALQDFSAPAMSVNMAFTDGSIAYRLSGIVPVRGDAQRADFPRDGATRAAGWVGRLPIEQKPQLTTPPKGYIDATNQRVVENGVLSQEQVGFESARPWRAKRVDVRLRELLEAGKPSADELLAIQQDVVGGDAVELAPVLGEACKAAGKDGVEGHDEQRVTAFCDAIANFDGVYTTDSLQALPYARFAGELTMAVMLAHVDADLAGDIAGQTFVSMALHDIYKHALDGETVSPVLDDPKTEGVEGLVGFAKRALKPALDLVVKEAGGGAGDWRWGKLHTLSLRGALASAPVVGFLFETAAREEAGTSTAPRAESAGLGNRMRVGGGAGLRLIAEMTDPPTVRMVNDSGQSGHFGHRHLEDQNPLWSKGEPRLLTKSKKDAAATREGALVIKPKR